MLHYLLHNFILFVIVQLTIDDVSFETSCVFIKNELQKHRVVHKTDDIII